MLYDVRVRIAFQYDLPAGSSRHLIRLFPRVLPGVQWPVATEVSVLPATQERSSFIDFFGNQVQEIFIHAPHPALELRMHARIDRFRPPAFTDAATPLAELEEDLAAIRDLGPESPHHFLGRSNFVRPSANLRDYVSDLVEHDVDTAGAVIAVGEAIHARMAFDSAATNVDTPHETAFEKRRGVCQDFTHIMIACLRSVGIPAGYVSGLLRTRPPPGQARLSGADSMHAWVRAWCGAKVGWFEYDPTNAVAANEDHIEIARGRDYFDVSPVKGVLRTAGSQKSVQQIDVVETQTGPPSAVN
jgi:transglutaminase-like putative cysteine protease